MTKKTLGLWIVPAIGLVLALLFVYPGFAGLVALALSLWQAVDTDKVVVPFIAGVAGSLVAAGVYGRLEKWVWEDEVLALRSTLSKLVEQVTRSGERTEQLAEVVAATKALTERQKQDHDLLLGSLVPALGGPFPKSLFAFPPATSREIARILSAETDRLYGRHHKRVVVENAKDHYSIKSLKRIDERPVWELDFHTSWWWKNDSKVTKDPLADFLLVLLPNEEARGDFMPADVEDTEAGKIKRNKYRAEFLQRNIVKTIVVNPLDPTKRIGKDLMEKVFRINKVVVSHNEGESKTYSRDSLVAVQEKDLPRDVYGAWSLPALTDPLSVGDTLSVEYFGTICLEAAGDSSNTAYSGYIGFPPSDVIGERYELRFDYPTSLALEADRVSVEVVPQDSGCRFIHESLLHNPHISGSGSHRTAQMRVPGPLTDLHQIEVVWRGSVVSRPTTPADRAQTRPKTPAAADN